MAALANVAWWVLSLVTGAVFGLIMGPLDRRASARCRAALGELPDAEQREVRHAAMRGPVPADPEVDGCWPVRPRRLRERRC
jgi:hypothetical protein